MVRQRNTLGSTDSEEVHIGKESTRMMSTRREDRLLLTLCAYYPHTVRATCSVQHTINTRCTLICSQG